jgi:hypothetical protein
MFLPVVYRPQLQIEESTLLIVCLQPFHLSCAMTTASTTTWELIITSNRDFVVHHKALEVTSPAVSLGAVGSQRTLTMWVVTMLPDWGLRAHLIESQGVGSSMRLELLMPLRMEEGEELLSQFLPTHAEIPPWECGNEVNEETLD